MAQWGIGATPTKHREWSRKAIKDDAVKMSNSRGTITFATSGKDSRTTQLFVNFVDNKFLDKEGFAPVGRVIKGLDVIDSLYAGYGEGGKGDGLDGKGPSQGRIVSEGNAYLDSVFPKLSYIISTTFV
jgi:cyclophilin family peptidyl-prolyl cis-trans isomerase